MAAISASLALPVDRAIPPWSLPHSWPRPAQPHNPRYDRAAPWPHPDSWLAGSPKRFITLASGGKVTGTSMRVTSCSGNTPTFATQTSLPTPSVDHIGQRPPRPTYHGCDPECPWHQRLPGSAVFRRFSVFLRQRQLGSARSQIRLMMRGMPPLRRCSVEWHHW